MTTQLTFTVIISKRKDSVRYNDVTVASMYRVGDNIRLAFKSVGGKEDVIFVDVDDLLGVSYIPLTKIKNSV